MKCIHYNKLCWIKFEKIINIKSKKICGWKGNRGKNNSLIFLQKSNSDYSYYSTAILNPTNYSCFPFYLAQNLVSYLRITWSRKHVRHSWFAFLEKTDIIFLISRLDPLRGNQFQTSYLAQNYLTTNCSEMSSYTYIFVKNSYIYWSICSTTCHSVVKLNHGR